VIRSPGWPHRVVAAPNVAEPASHQAARGDASRPGRAAWRLPGWLVAGVPVAAALAAGGYRLDGASLWRDEAYTLAASQRPLGQIFGLLLHDDAVHGPYYLGMHVTIGLLGTSEAALRLPSLLVAMIIGPQRAARLTSARPDNLRAVSAVVAAHGRPGDAILYIPSDARVVSTGYSAPFRRLRDLALKEPAAASDTLTGVEVPGSALAGRSAGIRRLWLVQWADQMSVTPGTEMGREKLALARSMHLIRRWTVQSVVLSLYAAGQP
jgi:hypothetical protein